ncbi:MAG: PstS family phosphate ABC transporter substrate-binding protein [Spirochaetales bacterium]|nr:PstS family phosphate ABC transporter substrate-binding protein [Spirochaetales bacterium]MCF7937322.1 PstS family phosphate ABC transporter substrate-binding protein [Spirochaetales bacterium]
MRKVIAILFIALLVPAFSFAGGSQEEASGEATGETQKLSGSIKIAGSSTVYPVSMAMAEEFSRVHPDVEIPVQSTGTGGGFNNFFIPGKTVINDASRKIKDSEVAQLEESGVTALEFQVGTDAITIAVNKNNPVDNITVKQLAQIWRPENPAQKWSDVDSNWPDAEFELYGPTGASGTFAYFTEEIVGEEGASRSDYQGTEQDNTIVQAVSGSETALGYFGMAYYLENKDKVKALSVNGVMPSLETAKSGEYSPLSRPLFIYVRKDSLERPEVREFVRFYLERIDTEIISQIGYVPMTSTDKAAQMEKFESALADLGVE